MGRAMTSETTKIAPFLPKQSKTMRPRLAKGQKGYRHWITLRPPFSQDHFFEGHHFPGALAYGSQVMAQVEHALEPPSLRWTKVALTLQICVLPYFPPTPPHKASLPHQDQPTFALRPFSGYDSPNSRCPFGQSQKHTMGRTTTSLPDEQNPFSTIHQPPHPRQSQTLETFPTKRHHPFARGLFAPH